MTLVFCSLLLWTIVVVPQLFGRKELSVGYSKK